MSNFRLTLTAAAVAILLLPVSTNAQKAEQAQGKQTSVTLLEKPRQATPAQLRAERQKVEAKTPLLFKGKVFQPKQSSTLKLMSQADERSHRWLCLHGFR